MTVRIEPAEWRMLAAGGVILIALLIILPFAPGPVLTGWLAAAVGLGAVPSGALLLTMMMRLIPGAWGEALRLSAEAASLLLPTGALAMVPVLVGMAAIYPWVTHRDLTPFQLLWLAPVPFLLRTVVHFGAMIWLARRMRRRRATVATAAAGVIVMPLLTTLVATDWLMSLDPEFASSAFGLRFMVLEATAAFCILLLLRLHSGHRPPPRPGVLGGLLLTLLLMSAYFLFLPFFVIWSSNIAANVGWYADRWTPGWQAAAWGFGLLGGGPIAPLLFARVRSGARWLTALSVSVLAACAIELAWLALPGRGVVALAAYIAALAAIAPILAAALRIALRTRVRARLPREAR